MSTETITVKLKSGEIEVKQFSDIPSAIEYFTVRDGNGNVIERGEKYVVQLTNQGHEQNMLNQARDARRPVSFRRLRNIIRGNPEFRAELNMLLSKFNLPKLRD